MHYKKNSEQYRQHRLWLTKIWFVLVLVNACLQLQVVEDLLSPKSSPDSGRFVVAELECSSFSEFLPGESRAQLLTLVLIPSAITNNGNSLGAAPAPSEVAPKPGIESEKRFSDYQLPLKKADSRRASGLSPPIPG